MTEGEEAALVAMYEQNLLTVVELARRFGVSKPTLYAVLKRHRSSQS